jgi:hypothetical protein
VKNKLKKYGENMDGLTWIYGLGLPQILLWVLTFAITYAALKHLINKRAAALISIALGFLVLMAVPAALITFLASLSTGLVALAIGLVAFVSVLAITGTLNVFYGQHLTAVALVVIIIVAAMFVGYGGLGYIGITGIPAITSGMWVLILVAVAVVWMLAEKTPAEKVAEQKKE